MRPLLVSIPSLWVGLMSAPLVAYLILQSELPKKARRPAAAAGVLVVAALTIYYWHESMPVHAYGVMLAIAALVGITVGVARSPVVGFNKVEIVDFGLFAVLWGVVGARLFHVFERHELYCGSPGGIARAAAVWNGGLVFYGGMIGAMLYVVYYAFRRGDGTKTLVKIFDLGAPCMMFGLAFGRVGCFLNGCCYGSPSSLPWSVQYWTGYWDRAAGRFHGAHICDAIYVDGTRSSHWRDLMGSLGVPQDLTPVTYHVHPAQLYESATAVLIGILLSFVFYRRLRAGWVSCALLLTYPVERFIFEGWARGDTPPALPGLSGLTISQYVSLAGFVAGLVWLVYLLATRRTAAQA